MKDLIKSLISYQTYQTLGKNSMRHNMKMKLVYC